jgi:Na+/H+-translocating membrane pyrophosphatase
MEDLYVTAVIALFILIGLIVTKVYWDIVAAYDEEQWKAVKESTEETGLTAVSAPLAGAELDKACKSVASLINVITKGAQTFLYKEYQIMGVFIVGFGIIIFLLTGTKGKATFGTSSGSPADTNHNISEWEKTHYSTDWWFGLFSTLSFVVGALTSMAAGYIGMSIAVLTNGRVTMKCTMESLSAGFAMAIRGGMVMGFGLLSLGLAMLYILIGLYKLHFKGCDYVNDCKINDMYNAVAAFGLGGSSIALFGRVGGGIYTKAADVGADLFGKNGKGLDEDDARNPAVIADNVGDNVGDIAGMGSDLFGSFAEGTCAAMVVLSSANNCIYFTDGNVQAVANSYQAMMFPMSITASGLVVCFVTSWFATICVKQDMVCTRPKDEDMEKEKQELLAAKLKSPAEEAAVKQRHIEDAMAGKSDDTNDVETTLKNQLVISTVIMTPVIFLMAWWLLPHTFYVDANLAVAYSAPKSSSHFRSLCEEAYAPYSGNALESYQIRQFGNWTFSTTGFNTTLSDEENFQGANCMGAPDVLAKEVQWWEVGITVLVGLWAGLVIGFVTEYYTSKTYEPVKSVAFACQDNGAAVNIIYGLALGYLSVTIPVVCLTIAIYCGFTLASMFGVACAALGMLSTMAIGLTIDGYGPISDCAGGIAEMVPQIPERVREDTDALDAAGNTTAAIGKGFAIGSAAMVAIALFGGYCTRCDIKPADVSILEPMTFAGLLLGAMIPYWFSAMTMKSVGAAANDLMAECTKQFAMENAEGADNWWEVQLKEGNITDEEYKNKFAINKSIEEDADANEHNEGLAADDPERKVVQGMDGREMPPQAWYDACIAVATVSSLKEMVPPAALVMLSPLVIGIFFGKNTLAGLLVGAVISGVQVALSASNTGGAWDNAKKFVEGRKQKGTDWHKAAVVGDTVGDPLKDTSGPAVNIVMKLMAIIALVCAPFIASCRDGYGLIGCSINKACTA